MTPEQAARATATAVSHLAGKFMLDPATYQRGGELGYPGMGFYVGGRGGVLGDVDGDVVAAAFVVFNPAMVRDAWEACAAVSPARTTAEHFAACGYEWARTTFPDDLDTARLADLAAAVVQAASPAGAPLFAAWRALPEPADPPARALHHMNALRELRFAYHGAAVLSAGISPVEAVLVKSPHMAPLFGWTDPAPDVESVREQWQEAEARTEGLMVRALGVLSAEELDELSALAAAAWTASGG
jgi:hypothetical protein